MAISWNWAGYHTSSERGISGLSADQNFLNFFNQIAIFKHIFEWCRPHASKLHFFACHTFTSWRRWGYHTSFERGRSELSSDPHWIYIFGEIGLIQAQSPSKSGPPRMCSKFERSVRVCAMEWMFNQLGACLSNLRIQSTETDSSTHDDVHAQSYHIRYCTSLYLVL